MNSLLITTVLFFPFWFQTWEQRPFLAKDFDSPECHKMEEALYPTLRQAAKIGNANLRNSIYNSLASAPILQNQVFLLEEMLPNEKSPELQASILRRLEGMDLKELPAEKILEFTKSQDTQVAVAAIRLYGRLPEAKHDILLPLLDAPKAAIQKAAWEAYANSPSLAEALGRKVLDYKDSPNFCHLALKAALLQTRREKPILDWQLEAASGKSPEMKLAAASDCAPRSSKPYAILLKDASPAIRQAACLSDGIRKYPSLLTSALNDQDSAVRSASAQALGRLDSISYDHISALLKHFGDSSPSVRKQVREAFVKLAKGNEEYVLLLKPLLASNAAQAARINAIIAAKELAFKEGAPDIAAGLSGEKAPEVIATSLEALASLANPGEYGELLIPYARHASPLVRQMTARVLGRLRLPGSEAALISLSQASPNAREENTSREEAVRSEAFEAMGRFPQMQFASALIACLERPGQTSPEERANAAWALGQLRHNDSGELAQLERAAERLKVQCTKPVVPGMLPMFEGPTVLSNAFYSLAAMVKHTGSEKINDAFSQVVAMYDISMEELAKRPPTTSNTPIPHSDVLYSLIEQAKFWSLGQDIKTQQIPFSTIQFPISQLK